MVLLEVTEKVRAVIEAAGGSVVDANDESKRFVSHGEVFSACSALGKDAPGLKCVLQGGKVFFSERDLAASEAPTDQHRLPELEARLERLRRAEEAREYEALTRDVAGRKPTHLDVSEQVYAFKSQLSIGLNVLATMATCFAVGFFTFYVYRRQSEFALIGGLIGLVIALFVDVGIIIVRIYAIERAAASKPAKEPHLHVH